MTVAAAGLRCWLVHRAPGDAAKGGVAALRWDPTASPGPDEAVVAVEAAGFNYKDALACAGHPGVMRIDPLVPGIDLAGTLLAPAAGLAAGTSVVATGHGLGERRDGGFATHARVPMEAVIARPAALDAVAAMALGTAGLTALVACDRLDQVVVPHGGDVGDWLVTGASGGVGMLAVARLAAAGRRVVACTRKAACHEVLEALGAAEVAPPADLVDPAPKSLVRGRWTGVVDTVGGSLLADLLRSVRPGGAVAAIGMAGGDRLDTTVHPFILRGVTLAGIDAASLPTPAERRELWRELAAFWPRVQGRLPVTTLALDDVDAWAERMRRGETAGRGVVRP